MKSKGGLCLNCIDVPNRMMGTEQFSCYRPEEIWEGLSKQKFVLA